MPAEENAELKKLQEQLAAANEKIAALTEENRKLAEKAAAGSAVVEISCPACQSKITSDGSRLVRKNREFQALEALADEADRLKAQNTELTNQVKQLQGQSTPKSKKSGFAVLSR